MKLVGILVLGTKDSKPLTNDLFDYGFAPLLCSDVQTALIKIHRGAASTVVVDADHADADPLEFVLNVHDLGQRIPVFVVSRRGRIGNREVLSSQPDTYVLERSKGESGNTAGRIQELLAGR